MPRHTHHALFAHLIHQSMLDMRLIGWQDEDRARADRGNRRRGGRAAGALCSGFGATFASAEKETLLGWRIADLLHNTPADLFEQAADTGMLHEDGTPLSGVEVALVNWVRLLPSRYGISVQDDLVLSWAEATLKPTGWTLHSLYRWAACHIYGDRHYPTCPTAENGVIA